MHKFLIKRTLITSRVVKKTSNELASDIKSTTKSTPKKQNKYSKTILLPRSKFNVQINGKERIEKDKYLSEKCGFSELYEWQRKHLSGPDFILHDGPPYANGILHMGHAINKILKDITLRYKIINGNRVHYVPGWDCHGLPIELKVIRSNLQDPLEIRKKARKYAEEAIVKQKQAFQSWGVIANWNESGCYFTNNSLYMKHQFHQFIKLYEKGIIFRDFMPVYWSPSSKTALAESELEYNQQHQSKAVIIRLRMDNISNPNLLQNFLVYALIWTSTPWSLVANQAVCFSADAVYCIVKDNKGNLNIIAEELLKDTELKIGPLEPVLHFKGRELEGSRYFHPFKKEKCPFFAANHVTTNCGTGLVHTAPAHGQEDFLVALENKMHILSMVDAEGRYTEAAGPVFHGLQVLTEGVDKVMNLLAQDILHVETLIHSYPYDWRTKQPVIRRASNQWFFNIDCIRDEIIDAITGVNIYPKCNRLIFLKTLFTGIKTRPYWCISRQRCWGTPIPVLYSKTTGKAFTNKELVERLCNSIDRYGPDCWWEYSVKDLIGLDVIEKFNITADDVEKRNDIMDIWFDSGISWSMALPNGKADLYLEGYDQFNGWFQTSLITSVALQKCSPYSALFVHGFAVDENCLKMSKSVGNVVSPEELLLGGSDLKKNPIYGIDILRWWVASHGCQHTQVPISKNLFDECKDCIRKLRLILRFLLGVLHPYHQEINCKFEYRITDKYMLYLLYRYNKQMQEHYDNYDYHHVAKTIMHFITNDLSAFYCTLIKDRLYCDEVMSSTRIATVQVIREIFNVLIRSIAPILPHLAEEAWLHYPEKHTSIPLHCTQYKISESWNDPTVEQHVDVALQLRKIVLKIANVTTWKLYGIIEATEKDFVSLSFLQDGQSSTSELCEILQLSSIELIKNDMINETQIQVYDVQRTLCDRCRRYPEIREDGLCSRCIDVLAKNDSMITTV